MNLAITENIDFHAHIDKMVSAYVTGDFPSVQVVSWSDGIEF